MARRAVPLHGYQRDWMLDKSRFKIGMFARQTGKTFTTTLEIVDDCFEAMSQGRRARWVILSRGERQASEAMEEGVKRHARAYGMALEELGYDFVADDGTKYKALEVVLPGGSRITALPANPDTARGYSANVFLDEFALHAKSREIWGALFPIISAGHRIRVTSTPHGKGNKFYELMTGEGEDDLWSRHTTDIHDAVADGLPRDVGELRAGLNDDELWAQEYELAWLDEASAWLPYDLINSCEDAAAGDPSRYEGGVTFFGNDIARRRHLWVLWVLELVGDVAWTREIIELRNAPFSVQDATMDEAFERYRPVRIAMDQTGMGEKPVEDAQRRYGEYTVEGVNLSVPRRLAVATALKERFEDRRIRIPAGNRELRTDLHGIKRIAGATGAPRLVYDEDDAAGANSHSDRFWAGALAAGAAAGPPPEYSYTPVRPRPQDEQARRRLRMTRGSDPNADDDRRPRNGWDAYLPAAGRWR
ncbi:MAG: terminase [Gammaproteobacteria bacterium]|nr:terminase [Gammaproteobacteria bacterium]